MLQDPMPTLFAPGILPSNLGKIFVLLISRIPYFIGVVNSLSIASRTNPRIVNIDYMNDLAIQLFDCYFDLGKDEVGSSNLPSSSMKQP